MAGCRPWHWLLSFLVLLYLSSFLLRRWHTIALLPSVLQHGAAPTAEPAPEPISTTLVTSTATTTRTPWRPKKRNRFPPRSTAPCVHRAVCMVSWGRLANLLVQGQRAIWLARKKNYCFVLLQSAQGLMQPHFDFPEDGVLRLQPGLQNVTVNKSMCAYTCNHCYCPQMGVVYPAVDQLRQVMMEEILPYMRCKREPMDEGTLLMHLRGGDLYINQYGNYLGGLYPQPPCVWWLQLLQTGFKGGRFPKARVIVEPGPKPYCYQTIRDYLVEHYGNNAQWQSESIYEDVCTMTHARHLAISYGTWGHTMAHLNQYLDDLYVPFGEENRTHYLGMSLGTYHWWKWDVCFEGGLPYNQHVYTFPDYKTTFKNFTQRWDVMLDYNQSKMMLKTIPAIE